VDYGALGGHMESVRTVEDVLKNERVRLIGWNGLNPWPVGIDERREARG